MNIHFTVVIGAVILLLLMGSKSSSASIVYSSDLLKITKVADEVYIHASYLATQNYGKVPCNGMFVINEGEAIVCDTPTDNGAAKELIEWITTDAKAELSAVVVTHFHVDCLGGLESFHDRGVPSFANESTIALAREKGEVVPQNGFETKLELPIGNTHLMSAFHGAGHTKDNIVCYYESAKVLFGGCLVKALGAGKGNLNDADVGLWSSSVRNVKKKYPNVEIVIPGHGSEGDTKLLDFTIDLFDSAKGDTDSK